MARRKQSILKRAADGTVVCDQNGRPVVEKVVTASKRSFARAKGLASSPVISRSMTPEERLRYGC